nr:hypothetical protein [Candidatus Mycoplasma haematolamae]
MGAGAVGGSSSAAFTYGVGVVSGPISDKTSSTDNAARHDDKHSDPNKRTFKFKFGEQTLRLSCLTKDFPQYRHPYPSLQPYDYEMWIICRSSNFNKTLSYPQVDEKINPKGAKCQLEEGSQDTFVCTGNDVKAVETYHKMNGHPTDEWAIHVY